MGKVILTVFAYMHKVSFFLNYFIIIFIYPGLQFKHYSLVSHRAPACYEEEFLFEAMGISLISLI